MLFDRDGNHCRVAHCAAVSVNMNVDYVTLLRSTSHVNSSRNTPFQNVNNVFLFAIPHPILFHAVGLGADSIVGVSDWMYVYRYNIKNMLRRIIPRIAEPRQSPIQHG